MYLINWNCVSVFLTHPFFSSRLYRANEHGPHPPAPHGHGGPSVSHQHLKALTVPHVHLRVINERPGLTLPRHYIFSGLALCIAAVHTQHELWTTQQSTGEKMCGCFDGHQIAMDIVLKGIFFSGASIWTFLLKIDQIKINRRFMFKLWCLVHSSCNKMLWFTLLVYLLSLPFRSYLQYPERQGGLKQSLCV